MSRLVAVVGTVLLLGIVAFISQGSFSPATAGIPIPPPGFDELNVNGEVDIDITLCCGTSETVQLAGFMDVERGPLSKEGVIDIKIVSMSLTGTSTLLGPNTPVIVSLNPNGGQALGQLMPAKGIGQFSIPFMDVQIGDNFHFLQNPMEMSAKITGVPPFGDKFTSQGTGNPIQDNLVSGPDGVRGTLDRFNIDIKPPDKSYTITVLKQHGDTKAGLPGWRFNIYSGSSCEGGSFAAVDTDADGIAEFGGLAAGTYAVQEKLEPGWNNVTPLCQITSVPGGAGAAGFPACPIQPDMPPPAAGCDEFNSAASVKVQFTNPPSDPLDCDLGGPTLITRAAVAQGALDSIQTEIVAMNLTGICGGVVVTVRESTTRDSLGLITEQQNAEPGVLEFEADSFFDVFFEVDTPIGTLHNQEALHLECKIQSLPPYGCVYEPDVGNLILFNADKKEVAKLIHAAHIPLDPKKKLLVFENVPKVTPTTTPTLNPEFTEKIDVPLTFYQLNGSGWNSDTIKTMLVRANAIWSAANINFTWPNQPTLHPLADPATTQGDKGDVSDDQESDQVCDRVRTARDAEKPGTFPVVLVGALDDGETWGVALTKGGAVESGLCVLLSDDIKNDPHPKLGETLAHEMGHAMCLDHTDSDTAEMMTDDDDTNNLLHATEKPTGNKLTKPQMRAARQCAQELLGQLQGTPDGTPTPTPAAATPTPTATASPTKTPQEQRTRHVTLRCVRTSADQKVTGSAVVTEKKADQPSRIVLDVSCNSNTEPVVRTSYSISASATKNVQLNVSVDSRSNTCSFPGFSATERVSASCTASPEGLELVDTEAPAGDGDANKNDTVDSIDAVLILQFIAGLTDEWPNSDTNGDGTTNAIDVALILQFTAGFLTGLPA